MRSWRRLQVPVEYDLKRLSVPTAVFVGLKDTVIDPEALKRVRAYSRRDTIRGAWMRIGG